MSTRNPDQPSQTPSPKLGVRVIKPQQFDPNTPQTPGMQRVAAVSRQLAGSQGIWAGVTVVAPSVASGVHHHGELETVIYVVSGQGQIRWGERMEIEDNFMKRLFVLLALCSVLTLLIVACGSSAESSSSGPNTVHMSDSNFVQSSITIRKGERVNLVNDAAVIHIIENGSWNTETPRHKWTGVLIGSLSVAFAFEINASQFRAVSGGPSTGRADIAPVAPTLLPCRPVLRLQEVHTPCTVLGCLARRLASLTRGASRV